MLRITYTTQNRSQERSEYPAASHGRSEFMDAYGRNGLRTLQMTDTEATDATYVLRRRHNSACLSHILRRRIGRFVIPDVYVPLNATMARHRLDTHANALATTATK